MNPKSNDLISAMEYKSNTTSSREISEYLAMEWLKNSVDFEKILISLRQEFYLLECKFKINSNKKSHTRHSFFELEDKAISRLHKRMQVYFLMHSNSWKRLAEIYQVMWIIGRCGVDVINVNIAMK